jgi:hypothetical protein
MNSPKHLHLEFVEANLFNSVSYTHPMHGIDDSQVLRPPTLQSDEVFEEFLRTKRCPVCLMVPRLPAAIEAHGCGHEGCLLCLTRLKTCPVGRCGPCYNIVSYQRWPHRAKVSFDQDLLVKCDKCDEFKSGTVDRLVQHEKLECPARIIPCPEEHCRVVGTPLSVLQHYRKCFGALTRRSKRTHEATSHARLRPRLNNTSTHI